MRSPGIVSAYDIGTDDGDAFDDITPEPIGEYCDQVKVERALDGQLRWKALNDAERREAVTYAMRVRRMSLSATAVLLHVNNRAIRAIVEPRDDD
jgi:hypothetical protein